MLSKAKIKYIQSLKQNKFRKQHNTFVAEGTTNVLDFLNSKADIIELYSSETWANIHKKELINLNFQVVTSGEMERISFLKNPSEVLAIIKIPVNQQIENKGYILALDNIHDPGNLGTIIRTADWFGIHDIVCSSETVDAYNPKVVQATMGSLSRVRIHYTSLTDFFKKTELPVYGALLDGDDIRKVDKSDNGILLIGSEAHGISKTLLPHIKHKIRIPANDTSGAESLNAAIATALICYEFIICKR